MEYKMPNDIKLLCEKESLKDPVEQEKVKKELVKFLERYLDLDDGKNSLANITGIVTDEFPIKGTVYTFERDVAGRMMRTRDYTMQEVINEAGKKEVLVIAADRDWWDKYSGWVSIGLLILGFLLGLISDPIKDAILVTKPTNSDTLSVKVLSMPQQQESKTDQSGIQQIPAIPRTDSPQHGQQ